MGFFNGFALLAIEAGIKPIISNCDIKASGVGRVFNLERHDLVDKALSPMAGEIELLAVKQVCIAVMCGGVSSGFHHNSIPYIRLSFGSMSKARAMRDIFFSYSFSK